MMGKKLHDGFNVQIKHELESAYLQIETIKESGAGLLMLDRELAKREFHG